LQTMKPTKRSVSLMLPIGTARCQPRYVSTEKLAYAQVRMPIMPQ
jgi:hypothetical protein